MHELSIAKSLVEIATEHAQQHGASRIEVITLRIGALSCVHNSALGFSFELVTKDTMLEGAKLRFIEVPVSIYCGNCDREIELPGIQQFRCPLCDLPSADIRRGRELDVDTIEITHQAKADV